MILPQKPSCVNAWDVIFIGGIIEKNSKIMPKSVYNYLDFRRRTCYNVLSVIIGGDFSAKRADAPEESLEIYKIDGIKTEERQ